MRALTPSMPTTATPRSRRRARSSRRIRRVRVCRCPRAERRCAVRRPDDSRPQREAGNYLAYHWDKQCYEVEMDGAPGTKPRKQCKLEMLL